jgi:hypothetical protein
MGILVAWALFCDGPILKEGRCMAEKYPGKFSAPYRAYALGFMLYLGKITPYANAEAVCMAGVYCGKLAASLPMCFLGHPKKTPIHPARVMPRTAMLPQINLEIIWISLLCLSFFCRIFHVLRGCGRVGARVVPYGFSCCCGALGRWGRSGSSIWAWSRACRTT